MWIYKIFKEQDALIMKYVYLIAGAAFACRNWNNGIFADCIADE